jgi:hypothetical protein
MKIVLGSGALAGYPQGGGHWSWYLQYPVGLRALGHDVFWLELLPRSGRPNIDNRRIGIFFARMRRLGFGERCAVLLHDRDRPPPLVSDECIYGIGTASLKSIIRNADVLWNLHCSIRAPLLHEFKWKALLDVDPGILQVSALSWDMGIDEHDVLFSVGSKIKDRDCEIPKHRDNWRPFFPCVHMPFWPVDPPRGQAPITSVTQWNWGSDLSFNGRTLSGSKRDAYLRFLDLPSRCPANFVLAANIHPNDVTGDRELLTEHGWTLVHPHQCIRTVAQYQRFIRDSIAEFGCAKSVYTALRTGWFSDRSAAYLASGRPVLAEDTGFADHLPTGLGLLSFRTLDQAAAAVDELLRNYPRHQKAAREIAESYLSTEHVLAKMVDYCAGA